LVVFEPLSCKKLNEETVATDTLGKFSFKEAAARLDNAPEENINMGR